MIYEKLTDAQAADIPEPKYKVWVNGLWDVYTGDDIPALVNQRMLKPYEFRDRFTQSELIAMTELAKTDHTASLLLLNVYTATDGIDLDSQAVIDGLNYWVSVGVLQANRPNEIRA